MRTLDCYTRLANSARKIIKKIKKSSTSNQQFRHFQQISNIPEYSLAKDCIVRWGSSYLMLSSLLDNKEPLNLMSQMDPTLPCFSPEDWTIIESICEILAPLHGATLQIQNRRTTISSYIPICKTIISNYTIRNPTNLLLLKNRIAEGLEKRLRDWEHKKYVAY